MKLLKLSITGIIVGVLLLSPFSIFAQANIERGLTSEEIKKITEERRLVADKADVKAQITALDSIRMLRELIDEEEAMSPADELYDGIWDNQYVKSYSDVKIPDTFQIDLSSFVMPIAGRVTSSFGPRRRRFHYGTDLKLQVGDTVVAAFEGKVRIKKYEKRGYGYYLVLRHPNGLETVYGHLSEFLVAEGETVEAGQSIALGGNTGRSTGPHLHFECRFLGHAIDPAEIVDFDNFCTFDDAYVFQKFKINEVNAHNNKYTSQNRSVKYHRIQAGDTLAAIARRYGVSVNYLCQLNGLKKTSILRVGNAIRYS